MWHSKQICHSTINHKKSQIKYYIHFVMLLAWLRPPHCCHLPKLLTTNRITHKFHQQVVAGDYIYCTMFPHVSARHLCNLQGATNLINMYSIYGNVTQTAGKGKGKVLPVTGHEGPEGGRCIALLFLQPRRQMVGGQCHAPASLPPGKTRYPLYRRLGRPQGRSGRVRKISPPPQKWVPGYRVFPGGKAAGRGVDHPPPI